MLSEEVSELLVLFLLSGGNLASSSSSLEGISPSSGWLEPPLPGLESLWLNLERPLLLEWPLLLERLGLAGERLLVSSSDPLSPSLAILIKAHWV